MFNFKLTGADSISKEYKSFNTTVYDATQSGLITVYSEMVKGLQKHVQEDVYDAYQSEAQLPYMRRVDYGGGIPIISAKNMDYTIKGMTLTFSYEPSGKNTNYPTSKYVDGDKLINAIENSDYTWDTPKIPERHFWNNFAEEMVGAGGKAESIFVKGMNTYQPDLQVKADGRIQPDSNDTVFEQQSTINTSSNWDDEDLPF